MTSHDAGLKFTGTCKTAGFCCGRRQRCRKEGILAGKQPAIFKYKAVTICIEGKCLTYGVPETCIVAESDIFCGKVVGIYADGSSAESAAAATVVHGFIRTQMICKDSIFCIFAQKGNIGAFYNQLFFVNAGSNVNGNRCNVFFCGSRVTLRCIFYSRQRSQCAGNAGERIGFVRVIYI